MLHNNYHQFILNKYHHFSWLMLMLEPPREADTPPRSRHPPGSRSPPRKQTPPRMQTPPWEADIPWEQCMLGDTGNKRAICILVATSRQYASFGNDWLISYNNDVVAAMKCVLALNTLIRVCVSFLHCFHSSKVN